MENDVRSLYSSPAPSDLDEYNDDGGTLSHQNKNCLFRGTNDLVADL